MNRIVCFAVLFFTGWLFTSLREPMPKGHSTQTPSICGYRDLGDSVEFFFGEQKVFRVGLLDIILEKRIKEINQVNVAGDFNGWNPNSRLFQMNRSAGTLFHLRISKVALGKKGAIRQYKFVLNHTYWVEPPQEALNQYKGADGNTNLTLQL